MGLKVWNLLTDPYDHSELASNWAKVDQHDHSSGKGVQIPTGGIADGAISAAKVGTEQITAEKLAATVSEAGSFNTTTRTMRKYVETEAVYSNSTTSYTLVDSATVYVPKGGRVSVTYLAGIKATTASGNIQMFVDGNELRQNMNGGGVVATTPATIATSTFYGPLITNVSATTVLAFTAPSAEYNTTTLGTTSVSPLVIWGLTAGNHVIELKAKAGVSGTIQLKLRNLWVESKGFE